MGTFNYSILPLFVVTWVCTGGTITYCGDHVTALYIIYVKNAWHKLCYPFSLSSAGLIT